MDKYMCVNRIRSTPNPQQLVWMAAHTDISENYILSEQEIKTIPIESKAGEYIVKHLLSGNKGHWGPFEHPQISLACGYIPHSVMVQLRTHRHLTMDVQSNRYTGQRICNVIKNPSSVEEVFYVRPAGMYTDRLGAKYEYTESRRNLDLNVITSTCSYYDNCIKEGMPYEQARSIIPTDVRHHFILSMNARTFLHVLDMRSKKDAQLEIQWFCNLLLDELNKWMPSLYEWYIANRQGKNKLAP